VQQITTPRPRSVEVVGREHLERAQQLAAGQVREPEELEQHVVVAGHHATHDAQALAPRRARQGGREVGERGVAARGEEAEVDLGEQARQQVTEPERHAGNQRGEPAEHQS